MNRRKAIMTAAAALAFGIALAAQPSKLQADWGSAEAAQRTHWMPGTDSPMSAYEASATTLAPPR